ncbi:MAG: PilZ domain-containing protein [Azospirillaceae bacterium]|nr:PilZ domain-containing protein [Azospirillaceae bacterium]
MTDRPDKTPPGAPQGDLQLTDRRRAVRASGDFYPLRLGRWRARMVDWSATGIGIELPHGTSEYKVGQHLNISIHSDLTNAVALFPIVVRRVSPGDRVLGADFVNGGEDAALFLATLGLTGDLPVAG